MNKKLGILILAVVIIAITTVFRVYHRTRPTGDTVKIGALLALTGSGANYGKSLQQGIELAREEINAAGGIHGKPLEVIYEDSQADAKTGVLAFNKLTDVNKTPVVIGSISSVVLAVAPLADQKGVVLLNSSAISPRICDSATNFLFSIMVSGTQEAQFMARDIVKSHKDKPIAVLYSNNASGVDTKDRFVRDVTESGGSIALAEGYELNSTDFRAQLSKIRESGAELGYLIAFSSREFARILIQSKELGLSIHWYSYSGIETKETLDLAGNSAEGVIYSYPDYSAAQDRLQRFQESYKSHYNSWPDIYTVTSYEGLHMLADVMRTYGLDASSIQNGLRQEKATKGIFGNIRFQSTQCVVRPLTWKTVRNGAFTLLAE